MIKIQKSTIIAFFAFFIFFRPTYTAVIPFADTFYNFLELVVMTGTFIYFFYQRRRINIVHVLIILVQFLIFVFTLLSRGQVMSSAQNTLMLCTLIFLCDIFSDEMSSLLEALMLNFEISVYINLISLILFPERLFSRVNIAYGSTFEWFLGSRNSFLSWLLPGLVIALVYRYYKKSSQRSIILIAAIIITQFFQTSSTLIVSSAIVLGLTFFPYLNRAFRPLLTFFVTMIIQYVIVIANNVSFLAPIVEGILGKDLTFTNRTTIWENAIYYSKPLRGFGKLQSDQAALLLGNFGNYIWRGATHAHNQLLNICFQGGVISLVLMLVAYYFTFLKLSKYWYSPLARLLSFGLLAYIVAGFTEETDHLLLQLLIILPGMVDKLLPHFNNLD